MTDVVSTVGLFARRYPRASRRFTRVPGRALARALVLLILTSLGGTAYAQSFVWDFAANASCAPSPSTPVALCDSDYHDSQLTFADTTSSYFIVARGYFLGTDTSPTTLVVGTTTWTIAPMSTNNNLWAKFNGNKVQREQ